MNFDTFTHILMLLTVIFVIVLSLLLYAVVKQLMKRKQ